MITMGTTALRGAVAETLNRVQYQGERVIIERQGKPVAALVSADDLQILEALEDKIDLAKARKALKESGSKSLAAVRAGIGL